ncbi:MAG: YggT family protein [Cellvibrionaceae bacterium]
MNVGGGLQFLFTTLFNLYLYIVIARFVLQLARADFYNPVSQLIAKITSPLLRPLRKVIPGFGGIDIACMVLFLGLVLLKIFLIGILFGQSQVLGPQIVVYTLFSAASTIINFFIAVIFISVILSWIAPPGHPLGDILRQMAEPVLGPARRILPPMGGLDFSPMIVLLLLYFVKVTFGL